MLASDVDCYKVIDTDTHVIEPYDLWTSRLPESKWGDRIPQVRWDESMQEDAWYFGDTRIGAGSRPRRSRRTRTGCSRRSTPQR